MNRKEKILNKKPKYKIGDNVVYPDRYFDQRENKDDTMIIIQQSKIINSYAYLDDEDPNDRLEWFYVTEHVKEENEDNLTEDDILYKL